MSDTAYPDAKATLGMQPGVRDAKFTLHSRAARRAARHVAAMRIVWQRLRVALRTLRAYQHARNIVAIAGILVRWSERGLIGREDWFHAWESVYLEPRLSDSEPYGSVILSYLWRRTKDDVGITFYCFATNSSLYFRRMQRDANESSFIVFFLTLSRSTVRDKSWISRLYTERLLHAIQLESAHLWY